MWSHGPGMHFTALKIELSRSLASLMMNGMEEGNVEGNEVGSNSTGCSLRLTRIVRIPGRL